MPRNCPSTRAKRDRMAFFLIGSVSCAMLIPYLKNFLKNILGGVYYVLLIAKPTLSFACFMSTISKI
jgi:hypothetical protein